MNVRTKSEQVILAVGGEGGGYTILGEQHEGVWRFWREAQSGDSHMYDVDDRESSTSPAAESASELPVNYRGTLDEALEEINPGWPRLRPMEVHPFFASDIFQRVSKFLSENGAHSRASLMSKWQEICTSK